MSVQPTYLRIGHGTSHGRDTYGYNIVSLTDELTGKRNRCMGGGYDMLGTVVADWAIANHHDKLVKLADRAYYVSDSSGYRRAEDADRTGLYGLARHTDSDGTVRVTLDGACGIETVLRTLKEAGIELKRTHDKRGNTTGFLVS